jgi:hypothetical protein
MTGNTDATNMVSFCRLLPSTAPEENATSNQSRRRGRPHALVNAFS